MFGDNTFREGTPIYLQIMTRIKRKVLSGEWTPGERIPPVRELAIAFGVNPNTMQRSLSELEREGLLFSERTAGRYITGDTAFIERMRRDMAQAAIKGFIEEMAQLGVRGPVLLERLQQQLEEEGVTHE